MTNNFQELYDDYTQMMLFARSNKLKLESMQEEINEIKVAYREVRETSDRKTTINSLNGLKSGINSLQDDLNPILVKYNKIDDMLHQVDIMISDYYETDIEIDLYELNGIEKDLFGLKNEYNRFKQLELDIGNLKKEIDDKIMDFEI